MTTHDKTLERLQRSADCDQPAYEEALAEKDYITAIVLLELGIATNDFHAMFLMGVMLTQGLGIEKNLAAAAYWFHEAALRGHPDGQIAFATALTNGAGINIDEERAALWYFQAAQTGREAALEGLANLILKNPSVVGRHFDMGDFHQQWLKYKRPGRSGSH
jgi:TPR repeat protein